MSKDNVIYPLVIEEYEGDISAYFPDFPGTAISAGDINTAIHDAKELMLFRVLELESEGKEVPSPSNPKDIELVSKNDQIVYIEVFLPPYRDAAANKAVTVNCTVPQWLRDAGKNANLNFSQLLQSSVKDALGIKENR